MNESPIVADIVFGLFFGVVLFLTFWYGRVKRPVGEARRKRSTVEQFLEGMLAFVAVITIGRDFLPGAEDMALSGKTVWGKYVVAVSASAGMLAAERIAASPWARESRRRNLPGWLLLAVLGATSTHLAIFEDRVARWSLMTVAAVMVLVTLGWFALRRPAK